MIVEVISWKADIPAGFDKCASLFSFFDGQKHRKSIIKKKGAPNGQPKAYIKYIIGAKKQQTKEREIKKQTCPHLEPNQSKKLIKELGPSTIHGLAQDQKLLTKENFKRSFSQYTFQDQIFLAWLFIRTKEALW